jgi:hypothetical protein
MSKYTDQERDEILARSRELLQEREREGQSPLPPHDPPAIEISTETRNQRDRRELTERDAEWEIERAREASREQRERERANSGYFDQRLVDLESQLLEAVRTTTTVCEALEIELSRATRENLELKARQAQLETQIAELRLALAERGDRKAILDLPNPLNVN